MTVAVKKSTRQFAGAIYGVGHYPCHKPVDSFQAITI